MYTPVTQSQDPGGSTLAARLAKSAALKSAALAVALKSSKASRATECQTLEQIPNIGPSLAEDLRQIGIHHPRDLVNKDAFVLYQQLCAATGQRHDPCVLDTFMAATDFMRGAPAAPWWHYTAHRKALFGQIEGPTTHGPAGADPAAPDNAHAQAGQAMKKAPPP